MDEEYYDEQITEKKRRLTAEQVHLLERSFEAENKLEPEKKSELAKKLGLQPRQVAVWFQNRRARWKGKRLETEFDRLKSSFDALVAHHDSLLKDNNRLRSQVVSLTEKLREKEVPVAGGLQLSDQSGEEQMQDQSSPDPPLNLPKGEDSRLSTESRGSAVIDSDAAALLVHSSSDSYFQDGVLPSEEDGAISVDAFTYEDNWWFWT